jgi:hypothetical protein
LVAAMRVLWGVSTGHTCWEAYVAGWGHTAGAEKMGGVTPSTQPTSCSGPLTTTIVRATQARQRMCDRKYMPQQRQAEAGGTKRDVIDHCGDNRQRHHCHPSQLFAAPPGRRHNLLRVAQPSLPQAPQLAPGYYPSRAWVRTEMMSMVTSVAASAATAKDYNMLTLPTPPSHRLHPLSPMQQPYATQQTVSLPLHCSKAQTPFLGTHPTSQAHKAGGAPACQS